MNDNDVAMTANEKEAYRMGRATTERLYAGMFCIINILFMIMGGFNGWNLAAAIICGLNWYFISTQIEKHKKKFKEKKE
jgi:hypothetical protein